jgi:hypothetical protein
MILKAGGGNLEDVLGVVAPAWSELLQVVWRISLDGVSGSAPPLRY